MTSRFLLALIPCLFSGALLLLTELRWFRRVPLHDRLTPYAPVDPVSGSRAFLRASSIKEILVPLCRDLGERAARLLGVRDDLALRLHRVHSPLDATTFRVRQVARTGAAFIGGAGGALVIAAPTPLAILVTLGAPSLTFLAMEQRTVRESTEWKRRLFLELPVVAEQLGMLIASGYSLGGSMRRISGRGSGACARDLERVTQRVHHGLDEVAALREWSAIAGVPAVDRLVRVLAVERESGDLDRLIAAEARSIRRDAQRELIETIERRTQQVWVPVTVAALVPGVLLMAVPFVGALDLFAA